MSQISTESLPASSPLLSVQYSTFHTRPASKVLKIKIMKKYVMSCEDINICNYVEKMYKCRGDGVVPASACQRMGSSAFYNVSLMSRRGGG